MASAHFSVVVDDNEADAYLCPLACPPIQQLCIEMVE